MQAYLDNSATTRCSEGVRDIVVKVMMEDFGNPSSRHDKGMEAEKYLREARMDIAATLKADEKEIYFTSGGTESDNWALIGTAMANKRAGKHIITTAIEHAAVIQPMIYLQEQGFEVSYIPVDRCGRIDLQKFSDAIREDTILVSTMYVNNEIGTLEPIEEIGKIIKEKNPKALWHVDAIQAYGKYRIYPKKLGIDMLSVSGHKLHGPKGVGFLYVRNGVKIHPLILGGGQQKGMRSGTDNVPVSVSFAGVRSEVLLHALEERGIQVSSGSACSSNKKLPVSPVLKEIGLKKDLLDSTVRFSFCENTTKEELEYCLQQLKELLVVLRRYSRH